MSDCNCRLRIKILSDGSQILQQLRYLSFYGHRAWVDVPILGEDDKDEYGWPEAKDLKNYGVNNA